ncbi:DNA primase large subunit Spp2 [Pluteus cervinus]|uniref:DNA primase large subunit Spp2 n=1 Tax=Pluteus cervinus TaxID=181527 RepID=A0ACD3BFB6_9AGAR|nr:DNA primase large subunit Spp2 [Pluteus cervinus]
MFNARDRRSFKTEDAGDSKPESQKLNFYDRPPRHDVTLEEFEICALNRLRILAEIESSLARNRSWEEMKTQTTQQCKNYLPLDTEEDRKQDHVSHYVLRLAFCRSEDLRRRFIKAEGILFRTRFDEVLKADREQLLDSQRLHWLKVEETEKQNHRNELYSLYPPIKPEDVRNTSFNRDTYYKVRWTRVPDLIEKRKVFLSGGWAYVPGREQSSIIFQEFEDRLARALELTARSLPRLDEDSRLVPILDNLSNGFVAGVSSEWSSSTEGKNGEITAEMVDHHARNDFPMCMRTLHEQLRKDHHLKHFGRLQYGLFLKVLGLPIEESIVFWRKSFDRITDDKFNKEYKYNIRHSFGLEGKRANYPAKSCQQILSPGPSEHGCPYRHYSPENLQTALLANYSSQGLTSADLPEVVALVKSGHFHVACTRVFEITHASCGIKKGDGVGGFESVTHPNQYAARSIELRKGDIKKEGT